MQFPSKKTKRTLKKKEIEVGEVNDKKNHVRRNYPLRLTLMQDSLLAEVRDEQMFG